jgi:hypothetical protein
MVNSSPPDFHTDTHIHILYTGTPQFNIINIPTTDLHPIGEFTQSKNLIASPIHPIENMEGFT